MTIEVDALVKHFRVHRRGSGVGASLRGLGRRTYETVRAVDDITFSIEAGEVVGFLGPNGAGKTTTLKCLSGLLYPTSGTVRVLGVDPAARSRDYLEQITLVMGQRNQLFWDLPAMDTFHVNQAIYRLSDRDFTEALDELVELLELKDLLSKQVRTLSLGERMRCELAAALLHRPQVLFLDEPTLGLDLHGQTAIRQFIGDYNSRTAATVLLTSHYMADVTALAQRIIVIDHGRLRYDGDLSALVAETAPYRLLRLTLSRQVDIAELERYGELHEPIDGLTVALRVRREATREVAGRVLDGLPVADLSIEEPPVEDIIRQVFGGE